MTKAGLAVKIQNYRCTMCFCRNKTEIARNA